MSCQTVRIPGYRSALPPGTQALKQVSSLDSPKQLHRRHSETWDFESRDVPHAGSITNCIHGIALRSHKMRSHITALSYTSVRPHRITIRWAAIGKESA